MEIKYIAKYRLKYAFFNENDKKPERTTLTPKIDITIFQRTRLQASLAVLLNVM